MDKKIKNLSIKKTILLYMTISLLLSFLLSSYISRLALHTQLDVWRKYQNAGQYWDSMDNAGISYLTNVARPPAEEMTSSDLFVSELCDFLETYTVLLLSVIASCAAVFLFYRNKLKHPIKELTQASRSISKNDLNFRIIYENDDEMGMLCREFERMRAQLAENNLTLWKNLEDERALRAAISHDLRSPLSVLKGYHEMLTDYLPEEHIDIRLAMKMLSECGKQLDRMDAFVETMRKMSSLESRALVPQEFSSAQLAEDMEAELTVLQTNFGKQITLHAASAQDLFRGDKEIILEVVENLLSNALRYAKNEVTVTLSLTHNECRVCVTDDGTGFSENVEKLTRAFYRQNAKDSLKHAGIGMYISRLYCEKHEGCLLLENQEEHGASVTAVFGRIA